MKIGELAKAAGSDVETIRYYERAGLLPGAARAGASYRAYGAETLARLLFIRRCRALDMTHDEIRTLLACRDHPTESCEDVNRVVADHLAHVSDRIRELEALEKELRGIRRRCRQASTAGKCGILQELAAGPLTPAAEKKRTPRSTFAAHAPARRPTPKASSPRGRSTAGPKARTSSRRSG